MRPDYGIDAPGLVKAFLATGALAAIAALVLYALAPPSWWAALLACVLAVVAAYGLGMGGYMIYGSKIAKVRDCRKILDTIDWRGDERILDAGCGRGLMMIEAAKRAPRGTATGIDLWRSGDQGANSADATTANAEIAGVTARTTVETADIRALAFDDGTFDIVTSNWVVHNLESRLDQETALSEMTRVLRPNGTLILGDIEHRDTYGQILSALGFTDQRLTSSPLRDLVMGMLSFGSFRPFFMVAKRSGGA